MTDPYQQVPFTKIMRYDAAIFAENPEPRCPCLLLLDTSWSMQGRPIAELNAGLKLFFMELMADPLAAKRVEVAIVTFGPVEVVAEFETPDLFSPPVLSASGETPLGSAIERALELLRARKSSYRENGVEYYRPWVFLLTDGGPTDKWQLAADEIKQGESTKQFQFFAVGVDGANFDVLRKLSVREPIRLSGLRFKDLFSWLSSSLRTVSHSQVGDQIKLANPTEPNGWGTVG